MNLTKRSIIITMVLLALLCLPASAIEDNFNDNSKGSLWQFYAENANYCWVEETNQRLELRATSNASDDVAGYISNGWRLDVSNDFSLKVDFHYSLVSWEDGWVTFCLSPSQTNPRSKYVSISPGCDINMPYFWYTIIDDSIKIEDGELRSSNYGKLYISYNSQADELYLSYTGYGSTKAWITVPGLLKGLWKGEGVYVCIGGGSEYLTIGSGEAYLDNFILESGTVISDCCHPADINCNYVISMLEILAYIDEWAKGNVTMLEVLEAIDLWAAGHYDCDEFEQKFKPGEQP